MKAVLALILLSAIAWRGSSAYIPLLSYPKYQIDNFNFLKGARHVSDEKIGRSSNNASPEPKSSDAVSNNSTNDSFKFTAIEDGTNKKIAKIDLDDDNIDHILIYNNDKLLFNSSQQGKDSHFLSEQSSPSMTGNHASNQKSRSRDGVQSQNQRSRFHQDGPAVKQNVNSQTNYRAADQDINTSENYGVTNQDIIPQPKYVQTNQDVISQPTYDTSNQDVITQSSYDTMNQDIIPQQNYGAANQNNNPQLNYNAANQDIPQTSYGTVNQGIIPQGNYGTTNQGIIPQPSYGTTNQDFKTQGNNRATNRNTNFPPDYISTNQGINSYSSYPSTNWNINYPQGYNMEYQENNYRASYPITTLTNNNQAGYQYANQNVNARASYPAENWGTSPAGYQSTRNNNVQSNYHTVNQVEAHPVNQENQSQQGNIVREKSNQPLHQNDPNINEARTSLQSSPQAKQVYGQYFPANYYSYHGNHQHGHPNEMYNEILPYSPIHYEPYPQNIVTHQHTCSPALFGSPQMSKTAAHKRKLPPRRIPAPYYHNRPHVQKPWMFSHSY